MNRINKVVNLAKIYINKGYDKVEAIKKAEKEIIEKENNKYGIYQTTPGSYR